ncbi:MAG: hypothetical protein AAGA20_00630 [Planctomycetota bacterium]
MERLLSLRERSLWSRGARLSSEAFAAANGHNDLVDFAYFQANFGDEMQIVLTADVGYAVSIDAFDLGNFGDAITMPYVRITDENGAVLSEDLDVPLNAGSSPDERNYVFPSPPCGRILVLRFGFSGLGYSGPNVGIDNLTFTQQTAPPIHLGTNDCLASPTNGATNPALMRAWGSDIVAQNDVTLLATGVPNYTNGFFIASRTQGFVANPVGSFGNLCLGGAIGRYVGPGQVVNSGSAGILALEIDLDQTPTPGGFVSIAAGETWNFQAWFREGSIAGVFSNFSDALSIAFR